VRACLFGAYDDAWALATGLVALAGLAALVLAACVGRWRRVPPERYGPALDL
jgi:hypothetical protein